MEINKSNNKMEDINSKRYSLKWNDYNRNMQLEFKSLKESEHFVDLTLACDDGRCFRAHKLILAISSPFFNRILQETSEEHAIVILKDIRSEDMESILNFIYNGEVQVSQEDLAEFFKSAQTLGIKGLTDNNYNTNQQNDDKSSILSKALMQPTIINNNTNNNNQHQIKHNQQQPQQPHQQSAEEEEDDENDDEEEPNKIMRMTMRFDEDDESSDKSFIPPSGSPIPSTSSYNLNTSSALSSSQHHRLDLRVRATDPRPCPKCGKIYRSAHTLRTHLEDKHTICPGYRCVLCGTVAKSRNSLHSHMSRQHRGISTKDLPVLPMPAPFDPQLAARLLNHNNSKQGFDNNEEDKATTGSAILDTYLQFIAENSFINNHLKTNNNINNADNNQEYD